MKRIFHYTINEKEAGNTVEQFLRAHGYSRHVIIHLKKTKNGITVNGEWAYVRTLLSHGDLLTILLEEDTSSEHILPMPIPFTIAYEDEDILVVNKPADTPIHPSQNNYDNTLANGIAWYYSRRGQKFVYRCINRLDRDTTGLLIIAKHMLSAAILSQMMLDRQIHRTYLAIVDGIPPKSGIIDAPIGRVDGSTITRHVDFANGERAVTHYRRIWTDQTISLVELKLETGRTHQIRVHMQHLGYPLPGDYLYHPDHSRIARQALHSYRLEFIHPITKEALSFTAPLPKDMASLITTDF
ncbi:MAG: RluA family pseudouridine synthase [Lachnospiraceae bacterium]|jgi:23S rRNA pseudouridine1911/1915/1917 synthase